YWLVVVCSLHSTADSGPCLYRKLNSTIMVVKAPDDRLRCDAAYVLDGTMDWSVFAKCQRQSKNASARRSKITSMMLSRRPLNWGPFRQVSGLSGIIHR